MDVILFMIGFVFVGAIIGGAVLAGYTTVMGNWSCPIHKWSKWGAVSTTMSTYSGYAVQQRACTRCGKMEVSGV